MESKQPLCHLLYKKHLASRAHYTRSNLERHQPRLCKFKPILVLILKKEEEKLASRLMIWRSKMYRFSWKEKGRKAAKQNRYQLDKKQ